MSCIRGRYITYHYKSRRPGQAVLEQRIKEICQTRVRYGYRRIHVLLRREGCRHGQNKTRRIYRELGLQLRNKTPKRRVTVKLRDDRKPATRSNETWAVDFVHDQLATGRKLCVLTVVDTFSRYSPALEPRFTSAVPMLWRCRKGSAGKGDSRRQSVSIKALSSSHATWICGLISAASRSTSRDQISPRKTPSSKPSTAASVNAHWFLSLADAQKKMEDWRRYYNEERPHGAIGQKPPITLLNHDGAASPPP
jgi:putative transposase